MYCSLAFLIRKWTIVHRQDTFHTSCSLVFRCLRNSRPSCSAKFVSIKRRFLLFFTSNRIFLDRVQSRKSACIPSTCQRKFFKEPVKSQQIIAVTIVVSCWTRFNGLDVYSANYSIYAKCVTRFRIMIY